MVKTKSDLKPGETQGTHKNYIRTSKFNYNGKTSNPDKLALQDDT